MKERVDHLSPRQRAAVYWLAGTGLRTGLSESEYAGWEDWSRETSDLGLTFVLDGRVGDRVPAVWDQAMTLSEPELDTSQHLESFITCLSTPLILAMDPEKSVGAWIENVFFPLVHVVSLDLYEDVAFPGDDELDDVFADDRFQAAVFYFTTVCERIEEEPEFDQSLLDSLLEGASALNGIAE